jgi:tetratricopeptide (TPR) repeat protein
MTNKVGEKKARTCPYVGGRAYGPEDAAYFVGRARDAQLLCDKIFSSRLTILYAPSGVGKTSLLRTLVVPFLGNAEARAFYFDVWTGEDPSAHLKSDLIKLAQSIGVPHPEAGSPTLAELVGLVASFTGKTLVLILDQFEEFLNAHSQELDLFRKELGALIRPNNIDMRVLISLRQEFLAALEPFHQEILNLYQSTYSLENLDETAVREVIEEPARLLGITYESKLVDALIQDLESKTTSDSSGIRVHGVDLFMLQIVLVAIWKHASGKENPITYALYKRLGEAEKVLKNYVESLMPRGWRAQLLTARLLRPLAPPSGMKISYSADDLAAVTGLSVRRIDAELKRLAWSKQTDEEEKQRGILRARAYRTGDRFELHHDAYIKILAPWRDHILKRHGVIRRSLIATVAVVLVVSIVGWFWYSNRNLKEARDRAEKLVGFLISEDLLEQIRPVGRLEIMNQVQQEVQRYLESLADADIGPVSRRNRGLALINEGDLNFRKGKLQEAQKSFENARKDFVQLVKQDPENIEFQRNLANAIAKLGGIASEQLRLSDSLSLHREALDIRKQLVDKNANQMSLLRDLAVSHNDVAGILKAQGHISEALKHYEESIRIAENYETSSQDSKKWLYILQDGYSGKGAVFSARGNQRAAEEAYKRVLEKAEKAVEMSPFEPEAQYRLGLAIYTLASLKIFERPREVLDKYEELHKTLEDMTKWDPANAYWQREISATIVVIGEAHFYSKNSEEALNSYEKALSIFEKKLVKIDDTNANWRSDLVWIHGDIGDVLLEQKKMNEAIFHYDSALKIQESLAKNDITNSKIYKSLADLYIRKANALRVEKKLDAALQTYKQAVSAIGSILFTDPTDIGYLNIIQRLNREMGVALREKEDWSGAGDAYAQSEQALRQFIKLNPDNPIHWNELFLLFYDGVAPLRKEKKDQTGALGAYREALAAIEKAVALEPKYSVYQENIGLVHQRIGDILRSQGGQEKALAAYKKSEDALRQAIELKKEDAGHWNRLFLLFYDGIAPMRKEKRDQTGALNAYREALAAIEKAVALEPKYSVYQENIGLVHQRIGDILRSQGGQEKALAAYKKSEDALRQAIKLKKEDAGHWNRLFLLFYDGIASLHTEQKDQAGALNAYREALAAAEKAVALEPKKPVYHSNLSSVHQQIGDFLRDRGESQEALNSYHDALKASEKAVALEPKEAVNSLYLAYAHQRIGNLLRDKGDQEKALVAYRKSEDALRQAIKLKKGDADYWNRLFLLFYDGIAPLHTEQKDQAGALGAYREALAAAEKAVALKPEQADYQDNLTLVRNLLKLYE